MYGIVLMMALSGSGQAMAGCPACGYGGGLYGWNFGPCCPCGWVSCCGVVLLPRPSALGETSAEEQKTWDEYVDALRDDEQPAMIDAWRQADPPARRKLLANLAELKKALGKDKPADEGLTEAEQKKWDAHVAKLKGEKKKEAEEKWKKADLKAKRKMLEDLDAGDEED